MAILGGYQTIKYLWNNLLDYGKALNSYYQEKLYELIKDTPWDPDYQY